MEKFEIKLPKLGESIVSATVVSIYKKENDHILKDETLMEVATDKVNSEIPSPVEGKVIKILVKTNDNVQVGDVIAIVSTDKKQISDIQKPLEKANEIEEEKFNEKATFFSPAVLRYAKEHNISLSDLEQITGTGENRRVTKKDIENYISKNEDNNYIHLSPIRQAIASNMIKSLDVPHAYLIEEIDVTNIISLINENKRKFLDKYGSKLTITSFVSKAIALAAKDYHLVNSSYQDGKILINENINLGMAVNINDNVIVPVINNIEKLDLIDISKSINILAAKAKSQKLSKEETSNGTITLSNFGMTKVLCGLPIIKFPQASMIAIGAIKKRPHVVNEEIKIRSIMMLSMGFDHRIFDGIYACKFINEIKEYLENKYDRSF